MSYSPGQNYQFRYTLAAALFVHGLLIFGITVGGVITANAPNAKLLEVTLSLQPSNEAPEHANFQAAHNQQASGDSETEKEITTTQQALLPDDQIRSTNPLSMPAALLTPDNENTYRIITTAAKTAWRIASRHNEISEHNEGKNNFENKSLAELSLAIASLEARLSEKQQPHSKKPRTLRLTSTSALSSDNADYVRQWRNRVEKMGNLHYPQQARERKLYGNVRLLVGIQASGVVDAIEIRSSSGRTVLDQAAKESILLASPFEPFPPQLAARYDRIEVIRTWQFRKDKVTAKSL